MRLVWHHHNLIAHAARHYLGRPSEEWAKLGDHGVVSWTAQQEAAAAAGCDFGDHPRKCSSRDDCAPAVLSAAQAYERVVEAEWAMAQRHGLRVHFEDEKGKKSVASTWREGVIVIGVVEAPMVARAKTAYRDDKDTKAGPRSRAGVRKLRALASVGHDPENRWTKLRLFQLESALLVPSADPDLRHLAGLLA